VLDPRKHLTLSDAIAAQLVGHNHPRLVLQTRQQPFEEALCRLAIAPRLNEDIEHNAILIDGTPEAMLHVWMRMKRFCCDVCLGYSASALKRVRTRQAATSNSEAMNRVWTLKSRLPISRTCLFLIIAIVS
jgi:hypothetical protein